jgi:hypothetical protein
VDPGGDVSKDEIVLIEVSTEEIDAAWWAALRERLAAEFRQETIVSARPRSSCSELAKFYFDLEVLGLVQASAGAEDFLVSRRQSRLPESAP